LPKDFRLDYESDIDAQSRANPYLSWIFDIEVGLESYPYIRKNLNVELLNELGRNIMRLSFEDGHAKVEEFIFSNRLWVCENFELDYWSSVFDKSAKDGYLGVNLHNARKPQMNLLLVTSLLRENMNKVHNKFTPSLSLKECPRSI